MAYFAGIDLGSTRIKILLTDEDGAVHAVRQRPTPWRYGDGGRTILRAVDLLGTVGQILREVDELLRTDAGTSGPHVAAVAISGMGETGFVNYVGGRAVATDVGWVYRIGTEEGMSKPHD